MITTESRFFLQKVKPTFRTAQYVLQQYKRMWIYIVQLSVLDKSASMLFGVRAGWTNSATPLDQINHPGLLWQLNDSRKNSPEGFLDTMQVRMVENYASA